MEIHREDMHLQCLWTESEWGGDHECDGHTEQLDEVKRSLPVLLLDHSFAYLASTL